jgi:hypothetical protein
MVAVAEGLELKPLRCTNAKEAYRVIAMGSYSPQSTSTEVLVFADGSGVLEERVWTYGQKGIWKRTVLRLAAKEVTALKVRSGIEEMSKMARLGGETGEVVYDGTSYILETSREGQYTAAFRHTGSADEETFQNILGELAKRLK